MSEALATSSTCECPDAPWHGHRDRLAALMAALSIYTASLGKMALDIALLMQYEVGEAAEPGGDGRGGSSTMPHKRNPTACMLALAAAKRVPGLLADFLAGMVQEHERAVGGWQAEWPIVYGIVQSAGVALESMAEVAEGLTRGSGPHARQYREHPGRGLRRKGGADARAGTGPRSRAAQRGRQRFSDTGSPPDLPGLRLTGRLSGLRRRIPPAPAAKEKE